MSDAIVLDVADTTPVRLDVGDADPIAREEIAELAGRVTTVEGDVSGIDARVDAIEADGSITTAKLADGAVTDAKLTQTGGVLELVNTPNVTAERDMSYLIGTGEKTENGVTVTYSPNEITVNGTPTALTSVTVSEFFNLPAGTYYFSDGYEVHPYTEPQLLVGKGNMLFLAADTHVFTLTETKSVCFAVRIPANAGEQTDFKIWPTLYRYDSVKSNESLTSRLFERSDNLVDKARFTRNYYVSNTGQVSRSTTYFYTEKIPVTAGEQLSFSQSRFIAYYSGDTFVSGLNNPASPQTVPSGVNYAVLTGYASNINSYMVNNGSVLRPYADYIVPKDLGEDSAARNIIVFGDSWTDVVNTTYTRWPVLINQMAGFDVTSYGVTGSTIVSHITSQINTFLTAQVADVDTFILMGGVNDYRAGVSSASIVTAVQGYCSMLKSAYPDARFVYFANNQLYYSAEQLKFFNDIVEQLNIAGIEAYTMFAWIAPNQYADDFLHAGNAGNVCIANNILKVLRGGEIKTVVNKFHWDVMNDQSARIGQVNIFEFFENGYPRIEVRGVSGSAMADTTQTKTVSTKSFFTSAPWSVFAHAMGIDGKHARIFTTNPEVIGSNHQVTSFDMTWVTVGGGFQFTSNGNALVYTN